MKELVKITKKEGNQVVSARELYNKLGYDKSHWKRWYVKNIIKNDFAFEDEDYTTFDIMANGNPTKDFALKIEFAKKIAMRANTIEGEKVRDYFIEVEKALKSKITLPQSYKEALKELIKKEEEKELLLAENQNLEQALDTSEQWISIIRASKELGKKETCFNWRTLKNYSLEKGIEIKSAPCPRFGTKKLYHVSTFKVCYPEYYKI